jgi:putative RNA 2'-phosphotransferase
VEKRLIQLSKLISHALRHEPWLYELELDNEGWVSVEELLLVLQASRKEWASLREVDLREMIKQSSKKRHELKAGKIRALYGHSTPQKLLKEPGVPPDKLYHGTAAEIVLVISEQGLKPMGRHFVHLSCNITTARQVGRRKSNKSTTLLIKAKEAYKDGIIFYIGNDEVWLTDYIPPMYIQVE